MKIEGYAYLNEDASSLKGMSSALDIPLQKITYVIYGPPAPYIRCAEGLKGWDAQKQRRLHAENVLLDQRGSQPLFKGMLHLDIDFYFEPKQHPARAKRKVLQGYPCGLKPALFNLINFIEIVGPNALWTKDSSITSIKTRKIYDNNPRTEIFITEIK
jgi:Holliday junction resolvase RusA-like endonuclease